MKNTQTLIRRLSRCIDVAHDVRDAKALDESQIDSLIVAAAILNKDTPRETLFPIPARAWDLLTAAKLVCGSAEAIHSNRAMKRLSDCIHRFETSLPKDPDTGEVLVDGKTFIGFDDEGYLIEPPPIVYGEED
ncbi:hypothetical protein AGMMS50256_29080 [Betaproteobacteria bacterium]|nr:hypothetical protein AGMMS50256_29080 [Betaproteobacteria bacterium]